MKIPFGKHRGTDFDDLPLDYIKWLEEQEWISHEMRQECQYQIQRHEGMESSRGRVVKGPR